MNDKNDLYCSECGSPLTKALISSLRKGNGIACTKCGKSFQLPNSSLSTSDDTSSESPLFNFDFEKIGLTFKENVSKFTDGFKKGTQKIGEGIRTGTKSLGEGTRNVIKEGQKITKGIEKEIKKIKKTTK